MLVLIDIGNSNIVITRYNGETLSDTYRYSTDKFKSVDEYFVLLQSVIHDAEDIVISSVVPELNIIFKNVAMKYLGITPIFVGPGVKTGVKIKTDNPKEVGSDIVSSAAAVIDLYADNAIVVDMGTATSFTLIEDKTIKGVAIATGLVTQRTALIGNTSQLSQFEFRHTDKIIGTNTIDSLNSGMLFGNSLMIKGMVDEIKRQHGGNPKVLITGGASRFIQSFFRDRDDIIFDDKLLLKGLLTIYNKNK